MRPSLAASEALAFPGSAKSIQNLPRRRSLAVRVLRLVHSGSPAAACQFFKRRRRRKLQLLEIQQLGEKRFVAIVRVGKQKFLIGGAAASVSLLAEIQTNAPPSSLRAHSARRAHEAPAQPRWQAVADGIADGRRGFCRPSAAWRHPASGIGGSLSNLGGNQTPWTIVVLLTLLTLIPALLLSMTPFVRLLIVFHFLRQALGTQSTPTNQTLIGLALVLTFFLMQPVGVAIQQQAIVPLEAGRITPIAAVELGSRPLKTFMLRYVRQKDVALFLELAKQPRPKTPEDLSMRIVMPAYILSELKAGFQIGAVLFLPFLVIDMVVASITTSVGMMQLPPVVISTPLKLLLFVMVDGWNLLVGSLMRSFADPMPLEQVIQLGRTTLEYAILAALPLLAVATVVSVVINILQVLTSIQDQTVSTVPRLLATALSAMLLLPWMLRHLAAFTIQLFSDFRPLLQ